MSFEQDWKNADGEFEKAKYAKAFFDYLHKWLGDLNVEEKKLREKGLLSWSSRLLDYRPTNPVVPNGSADGGEIPF